METAQPQKRPNRNLLLGAALVLTGFITIFYFLVPASETPEGLMAQYYEKPAFVAAEHTPELGLIKTSFDAGGYKKAIVLLKKYENNEDLLFYQGICNLELSHSDRAIAVFKKLQVAEGQEGKATWFLALTYLQCRKKDLARTELEKLVSGEMEVTPKMKEQAEQLLGSL